MTSSLLVACGLICLGSVVYGCRRVGGLYALSACLGLVTGAWLMPQLIAIYGQKVVPDTDMNRAVVCTILTLVGVLAGEVLARVLGKGPSHQSFRNNGVAFRLQTLRVISCLGIYAYVSLDFGVAAFSFEVSWWLIEAAYIGLVGYLFRAGQRDLRTGDKILMLLCLAITLQMGVLLRREWLAKIVLLPFYFFERGKFGNLFAGKLMLVLAAAGAGGYFGNGTAYIRSVTYQEGLSVLTSAQTWENAAEYGLQQSWEGHNLVTAVSAGISDGKVSYGFRTLSVAANMVVPKFLVGEKVKALLTSGMVMMTSRWRGIQHDGTTLSMAGSLVIDFGPFFIVAAIMLGFFSQRYSERSRVDGSVIVLAPLYMVSASHGLGWLVGALLSVLIIVSFAHVFSLLIQGPKRFY